MGNHTPTTAARRVRIEMTAPGAEEVICRSHPGLAHPAIHEASHAVAAVHRGIEFHDIRVVAPGARAWLDDVRFLGRVTDVHEPRASVRADPVAAFEYALAGYVAEEELLGHSLRGSGDSDLKAWRSGAGFFEANQVADIERFLGRSPGDILDSVHEWALDSASAIERVSAGLNDPESVVMEGVTAEWCFSFAAVRDLVDE